MKVAILVDSLAVGGAERQAILCTAELRKLGHWADLVYYRTRVEYGDMLKDLEVSPLFVQARTFVGRCHRLRLFLEEGCYDVVHGFKMAAEVYAAIAGTWAGVPRRFGSFRSIYNLGWKHRGLHYGVDKLLDGWIVNSQAGAESMARLTRISPRKIHVLHNGFPLQSVESSLSAAEAKARLGLAPESMTVTMVGRLEREKNYPMLLRVAREVVSRFSETRFVIVGKGSLERELRESACALGLRGQVLFLGQRSDIGDILKATDISVLTSDREGLPNAVIESMAAGKPIVCSEYDGAREIICDGQNALLAPRGDTECFTSQVLRLIQDAPLRRQLGESARAYALRKFSAQAMAERLESIYLGHGKLSRVPAAPGNALPQGMRW